MWLPPDLLALCQDISSGRTMPFAIEYTPATPFQSSSPIGPPQSSPPSPPSSNQHSPTPKLTSTPFPLLCLPLDILSMHLPQHLPRSALLSLRLSCRDLHVSIPAPRHQKPAELNECERKATLAAVQESEEAPARKACVLCGAWYPVALFAWALNRSSHHHAQPSSPTSHAGLDDEMGADADLENRICRWHRGRFERTVVRTGKEEVAEQGWSLEEACMHCGGVLAWGRCDCEGACQTCWKRRVWCYTRIADKTEGA